MSLGSTIPLTSGINPPNYKQSYISFPTRNEQRMQSTEPPPLNHPGPAYLIVYTKTALYLSPPYGGPRHKLRALSRATSSLCLSISHAQCRAVRANASTTLITPARRPVHSFYVVSVQAPSLRGAIEIRKARQSLIFVACRVKVVRMSSRVSSALSLLRGRVDG
jgi:hypothetical protein